MSIFVALRTKAGIVIGTDSRRVDEKKQMIVSDRASKLFLVTSVNIAIAGLGNAYTDNSLVKEDYISLFGRAVITSRCTVDYAANRLSQWLNIHNYSGVVCFVCGYRETEAVIYEVEANKCTLLSHQFVWLGDQQVFSRTKILENVDFYNMDKNSAIGFVRSSIQIVIDAGGGGFWPVGGTIDMAYLTPNSATFESFKSKDQFI